MKKIVRGAVVFLGNLIALCDNILNDIDRQETFSDAVIRLARERNLSGPQVYRKAGIDAKHYSKIISDRNYQAQAHFCGDE